MESVTQNTIDQLNSFLRGEIAAVETYRRALDKVDDPMVVATLQDCLMSHQQRVGRLSAYINQIGGTPATSSGIWGGFAKLVEGSAAAFGTKAVVAALEEGEDHGLRDFRSDLSNLDYDARILVEHELLPAQTDTHRRMRALKEALSQRRSPGVAHT